MDKNIDIHVSLPESMLSELDRVAHERGVRRAQLFREAVFEYLKKIKKELVEKGMKNYVESLSSQSADFVRETDAHTVERLLRETEW